MPALHPTVARRIRRALALRPRLVTAAVTGTDGKTTTTSMIGAIVAASGEVEAIHATTGSRLGGAPFEPPIADPALRRTLLPFACLVEAAVARGVRTLAVEMTSHALSRGGAARWPPDIAVFTNLSRDHLDIHDGPMDYLAAKSQLFVNLPPRGLAVLNADDPASALIADVLPEGVRVVTYSLTSADAALAAAEVDARAGLTVVRLAPGPFARALGGELRLPLTGRVHAANALGAALATLAAGYPGPIVKAGLESFTGVPGRFERVAAPEGGGPDVFVDYAHTPSGLARTLEMARALVGAGGRLVCLFGCGGERDRGKRPLMGEVADALADRVYLSSDNPRREEPAQIAAEVLAGVPASRAEWLTELDRETAIIRAIREAGPADVVVLCGKGHERTQRVGRVERPLDDAEVARRALGGGS